jgi:hypothetical protein
MTYRYILNNPYIVGNPIKSKEMFFGREEDFKFIKEKLHQETKGIIITLAGERRSGKTSILFQIMNGRLGPNFLPFFVDMQSMADVNSNREFLQKIDDSVRKELYMPAREPDFTGAGFKDFENTIIEVQRYHAWQKIVFLFDEYELLEHKIEKEQISEDIFTFLANLMENHNVLFVFSGSNIMMDRSPKYWKVILSKSIFKNISFLNIKDCKALITQPCEGYVTYLNEYIDIIYRITAGQPFYTQVFCQNMVDRLKAEERNTVLKEDITKIIDDIITNPLPQMIYFWTDLSINQKLLLSIIAERIASPDAVLESTALMGFLKTNNLSYLLTLSDIKITFEELYKRQILVKFSNGYRFRVDLFRYWIKQDQNIWKVINDLKHQLPEPPKPLGRKVVKLLLFFVLIPAAVLIIGFTFGPKVYHEWFSQKPDFEKNADILPGNLGESSQKGQNQSDLELMWWSKNNFISRQGSYDKASIFAFNMILPEIAKFKDVSYSMNGSSLQAGMNSEKFAELVFRNVCVNYIQPWNREPEKYTSQTVLKSGDLLVFPKGNQLFYFDGWDLNRQANLKIAIGMTQKGIRAVSFSQDSILFIKSIQPEEYKMTRTALLAGPVPMPLNRNIINELGLSQNNPFRKILKEVFDYQVNIESAGNAVNQPKYNSQGFIAFIFSSSYRLASPDSLNFSQSGLAKWLVANQFEAIKVSSGFTFETGDMVFYSLAGKEYTMFYLKKEGASYMIGMTDSGVKMFKSGFVSVTGGIDINYFFSR